MTIRDFGPRRGNRGQRRARCSFAAAPRERIWPTALKNPASSAAAPNSLWKVVRVHLETTSPARNSSPPAFFPLTTFPVRPH